MRSFGRGLLGRAEFWIRQGVGDVISPLVSSYYTHLFEPGGIGS